VSTSAGTVSRDEAIELLSRRLHQKMEHLDPSGDPEWEDLSDIQKEFYLSCVKALLQERPLLLIATAAQVLPK
jgi:hypothetical protein